MAFFDSDLNSLNPYLTSAGPEPFKLPERLTKKATAPVQPEPAFEDIPDNTRAELDQAFRSMTQPQPTEDQGSSFFRRAVADPAVAFGQGAVDLAEAPVGLLDTVTQGRVGKALEQGVNVGDYNLRFSPEEARQGLQELYSPEAQAAQQKVQQAEGWTGKLGAALENPSFIVNTGVRSVPMMLGARAIAGKAAGAFLPAEGAATAEQLARAQSAASWGAGAAEGAMTAGNIAEQIRRDNPQASEEDYLKALGAGAGTAAITRLVNKIPRLGDVETAGLGQASKPLAQSVVGRTLQPIVGEGLEEGLQSAQERAWTNSATGKPLTQGTAEDAVLGALVGGATGIPFGVKNAFTSPDTPAADTTGAGGSVPGEPKSTPEPATAAVVGSEKTTQNGDVNEDTSQTTAPAESQIDPTRAGVVPENTTDRTGDPAGGVAPDAAVVAGTGTQPDASGRTGTTGTGAGNAALTAAPTLDNLPEVPPEASAAAQPNAPQTDEFAQAWEAALRNIQNAETTPAATPTNELPAPVALPVTTRDGKPVESVKQAERKVDSLGWKDFVELQQREDGKVEALLKFDRPIPLKEATTPEEGQKQLEKLKLDDYYTVQQRGQDRFYAVAKLQAQPSQSAAPAAAVPAAGTIPADIGVDTAQPVVNAPDTTVSDTSATQVTDGEVRSVPQSPVPPLAETAAGTAPTENDPASVAAKTWDRSNRTSRSQEWMAGAAESNPAFSAVETDGVTVPAHGMAKAATLQQGLSDLTNILTNGFDPNRTLYYDALTNPGRSDGAATGTAGGHAYRDGPFIITFREGLNGRQPTREDITGVLVNPAHSELVPLLQQQFPDLTIRDYNGVKDVIAASKQTTQTNAPQPTTTDTAPSAPVTDELAPTAPNTDALSDSSPVTDTSPAPAQGGPAAPAAIQGLELTSTTGKPIAEKAPPHVVRNAAARIAKANGWTDFDVVSDNGKRLVVPKGEASPPVTPPVTPPVSQPQPEQANGEEERGRRQKVLTAEAPTSTAPAGEVGASPATPEAPTATPEAPTVSPTLNAQPPAFHEQIRQNLAKSRSEDEFKSWWRGRFGGRDKTTASMIWNEMTVPSSDQAPQSASGDRIWDEAKGQPVQLSRSSAPRKSTIAQLTDALRNWLGNRADKLLAKGDAGQRGGIRISPNLNHALQNAAIERAKKSGNSVQNELNNILLGMQNSIAAWHGSPHDFDQFLLDQIGTGEGAQAYGHGLYFAGKKQVAEHYRKTLSNERGFSFGAYDNLDRESVAKLVQRRFGADYLDKTIRPSGVADRVMDDLIAGSKNNSYPKNSQRYEMYEDIWSRLSWNGNTGRLYQVTLAPQEDELLLWDRPLSEQSEKVKKAIAKLLKQHKNVLPSIDNYLIFKDGGDYKIKYQDGEIDFLSWPAIDENLDSVTRRAESEYANHLSETAGAQLYKILSSSVFKYDDKSASEYLRSLGVRGIKYLDGSSRGAGDGSYNYVIFDQNDITIDAKFSEDGTPQAFHDNVTGLTYLLADGMDAQDVRGVVLHESIHEAKNAELDAQAVKILESAAPTAEMVEQFAMPESIEVDGVQRSTRNSNGQFIHPTKEGIVNFWRWFGDSKVVDDQGRPLVVYHGTPAGNDIFVFKTRTKIGITGAHFGTLDQAEDRSAGSVYPVYLKIENPMRTHDRGDSHRGAIKEAKKKHHDGLVYKNIFEGNGGYSWVIFNPTQIKSATGNTGAFSAENPDIRYSEAGQTSGNFIQNVQQRLLEAGHAKIENGKFVVTDANEARAYLVEEAANRAKRENLQTVDSKFWSWAQKSLPKLVVDFLKRMVAAIRSALYRRGIWLKAGDLTVDDLVAVAKANLKQMADGGNVKDRNGMNPVPDLDAVALSVAAFTSNGEPTAAEIAEAKRQLEDVRKRYQGTDQWMKAPNGKPTKLNEMQWLQTRTENFKRWFGDSKVVDENGDPQVMHHGSRGEKWDSWSFVRAGGVINLAYDSATADGYAKGSGGSRNSVTLDNSYFEDEEGNRYDWNGEKFIGENGDELSMFEAERLVAQWGGQLVPKDAFTHDLFVNASNPLDLYRRGYRGLNKEADAKVDANAKILVQAVQKSLERVNKAIQQAEKDSDMYTRLIGQRSALIRLYNSLSDKNGIDGDAIWADTKWEAQTWHWATWLAPELRAMGYDGIIYKDDAHKTLAVFGREQIKSATGNVGTFSPDSPNINYSRNTVSRDPLWDDVPGLAPDQRSAVVQAKDAISNGWSKAHGFVRSALTHHINSWHQNVDLLTRYMTDSRQLSDLLSEQQGTANQIKNEADKIGKQYAAMAQDEFVKTAFVRNQSTLNQVDPTKPRDETQLQKLQERQTRWEDKLVKSRDKLVSGKGNAAKLQSAIAKLEQGLVKNDKAIRREEARLEKWDRLHQQYNALSDPAKQVLKDEREFWQQAHATSVENAIDRVRESALNGQAKKQLLTKLHLKLIAPKLDVYYPLQRFGNYWVYYQDEDGNKGFALRESAAERDKLAKELKADGYELLGQGARIEGSKDVSGVSPGFVTGVEDMIDKSLGADRKGEAQALKDALFQAYVQTLPELSVMKRTQHRKGTLGADEDALRSFSYAAYHHATQLAKSKYMPRIAGVLNNVQDAIRAASSDAAKAKMEEMLKRNQQAQADREQQSGLKFADVDKTYSDLVQTVKQKTGQEKRQAVEALNKFLESKAGTFLFDTAPYAYRTASLFKTLAQGDEVRSAAPDDQRAGVIDYLTDLYNGLSHQFDRMNAPDAHPAVQRLLQIGFIYNLISPSAMMINVLQTPLVAGSVLGGTHGIQRAAKVLGLLSKEYATQFMDKKGLEDSAKLSDTERRVLKDEIRSGFFDRTGQMELAEYASRGYAAHRSDLSRKVMDVVSYLTVKPIQATERLNREVTYMAAFKLKLVDLRSEKPSLPEEAKVEEAKFYARDVVRKTHFDYSSENRPTFLKGNVGRLLGQFRMYSQGMTYLTYSTLMKTWDKGLSAEEKAQARKIIYTHATMQAAVAGILGLPFVNFFLFLADAVRAAGDDDDQRDTATLIKIAMKDALGAQGGAALTKGLLNGYGIAGLTQPVDLHSRMSLANPWMMHSERAGSWQDWRNGWVNAILGPTLGGVTSSWMRGLDVMQNTGDGWRALEALLPKGIKDPVQAWRMGKEDAATNTRGDVLVQDLKGDELFLKLLGFTPGRLEARYDENNARTNLKVTLTNRRNNLIQQYVTARMKGDQEDVQDAMRNVQEWNRSHRDNAKERGLLISTQNLQTSLHNRKTGSKNKEEGLYMPKRVRPLMEEIDFAN